LINGGNLEDEEEKTNKYYASLIRPRQLTGKVTDEIRYEHSFEVNCILLSKYINQPVKSLTTKEYFTLIEQYNKNKK
jgi:hypothetical protein